MELISSSDKVHVMTVSRVSVTHDTAADLAAWTAPAHSS